MDLDSNTMIYILPSFKKTIMPVKISKKYIPNSKEKYMCEKHREYFKQRLGMWKNELIESNKKTIESSKNDNEISSADIVDQATSVAERSVELRTVNRQIKLISKIDKALDRIKSKTYGFCEDTGEPIGLKRLIARPIATLSIEAQERHEKKEKIFADS